MRLTYAAALIGMLSLGAGSGYAQGSSSSIIRLQRDSAMEQNLKYQASVDTAITPARVLRWMRGMMGQSALKEPSSLEFQPILNVHDSQQQIVGQFAYKF